MTIVCVVSIGVMKPHINTKVDPMILRIPPARVYNLIRVRGGVNRTI